MPAFPILGRSGRPPFRHRGFNVEWDEAMWDWISCNLLGRHQHVVAADHGSIHLRCLRCGQRSSGWQLEERPLAATSAESWRRRMVEVVMPRQHS